MLDQFINLISLHKTQIIVGVIVVIIGSTLIFLLRNLFRKLWQLIFPPSEKKVEQDNQLYQHFKDIKQEATEIFDSCINLTEYYGMILLKNLGLSIDWGDYVAKFGVGLLPQPSTIFAAHFPKETAEIAKWRKQIEEHTKKRFNLDYKVKEDFESQNMHVLNINERTNRFFYIYDTVYRPLFMWWRACNRNDTNPLPNFNKIATKSDSGPNNLYADGWGSQAIAYAKTDNGKKKCISVIRKVAKNAKYQKEVLFLSISTDIIKTNVRNIGNQLQVKINDVGKYWPGTKHYKFKKVKNCPRCEEIFN